MCTEHAIQLIKNLQLKDFTLDPLDGELQCMVFIRALPDKFNSFVSTLMIIDKLRKVDLVAAFHTEEVQHSRCATAAANVIKVLRFPQLADQPFIRPMLFQS